MSTRAFFKLIKLRVIIGQSRNEDKFGIGRTYNLSYLK